MATCKYCNFNLCFQCENPREDELSADGREVRCCCDGFGYREQAMTLAETFMANRDDDAEIDELNRFKTGAEMKDVLSTGRKRAAKAAPIHEGMVCEWAGLAQAGGGSVPIIGCPGNSASDIHHGGDKSVLNNVLGVNLHRICDWCHSRWHQMNDKYYGERPPNGEPFLPLPGNPRFMHDPYTKAEPHDIIASEAWWAKRADQRTTEYREWTTLTLHSSESKNEGGLSSLMGAGTSTEHLISVNETEVGNITTFEPKDDDFMSTG